MNTLVLPKTQHLVVFQEVIRSGSIGSAAKSLGLTIGVIPRWLWG
ncbi:hypothetical protein LTSEMIN_5020 [Salmonella enterica subsp. enterica serovar Minnesota str. A4-603]|nr:hypothetical protein LTSEMIN_5020 [Salmonella enterica subsp. enterica serovar Minnesota str. A4-603]